MKTITFGKRLRELRLEKGFKQKDLATLLSVHFSTISDWEVEKSEPSLQTLYNISLIFEVSTDYLLGVID